MKDQAAAAAVLILSPLQLLQMHVQSHFSSGAKLLSVAVNLQFYASLDSVNHEPFTFLLVYTCCTATGKLFSASAAAICMAVRVACVHHIKLYNERYAMHRFELAFHFMP